jgi:hypothetical protein
MNCDCIDTVQKKLAEFVKDQAGPNATATVNNTALLLGDKLHTVLQIPFTVKGTGKGYTSARGKQVPVTATFCPFCTRPTGEGMYRVGEDLGIAEVFNLGED